MYIFPKDYLDQYRKVKAVVAEPLPECFIKHRDLIKSINSADRSFAYSDCQATWRSGNSTMKQYVMEIQELLKVSESPEETKLLQDLIYHYERVSFESAFPELSHPDFTGKGVTELRGVLRFISEVGLSVLEDDSHINWLNECGEKLIQLINDVCVYTQTVKPHRECVVYCDPLIDQKKFKNDERFNEWLKPKSLLVPNTIHDSINDFLTDYKNALVAMQHWCKYFRGMAGFSSSRSTEVSMFSKDTVDYFEVIFTYGNKSFSCLLSKQNPIWNLLPKRII